MHCMLKDHIHRRFHMSPLVGVFFFILSLFCSPILEYQPSDSAYARTYTQSTTKKIHHPTTHIICICVCVRDIYRFISLKFCVCHTFVRYNINNNNINNPKKKKQSIPNPKLINEHHEIICGHMYILISGSGKEKDHR